MEGQPTFPEMWEELCPYLSRPLVIYNAAYEVPMLAYGALRYGLRRARPEWHYQNSLHNWFLPRVLILIGIQMCNIEPEARQARRYGKGSLSIGTAERQLVSSGKGWTMLDFCFSLTYTGSPLTGCKRSSTCSEAKGKGNPSMSLSDDDLLNNASPETRQRYENALARRRSQERGFQRVSPFAVARHVEAKAPPEQVGENQASVHEAPALPERKSEKQAWAHWEYSPEEWALFERVDWRPINLRFWLFAALSLLLLPDIGLIAWSPTSGHDSLLFLGLVLIFVWIPILAIFAIYIDIYDEAIKRHRVRRQEKYAHKVTFDSKGLWEAGTYFPLNDQLFVLEKVRMTASPPAIHFSRTRYGGRRTTPHAYPLHVLVPSGHDQEAADLVQRFQKEVIQARKEARQRWMNPPEPL